jgi:hypothetical protein
VTRVAVIPVYPEMSAAESWALIREHSEDGDQPVPVFVARSEAGEEPAWAVVEIDADGRYVRDIDED